MTEFLVKLMNNINLWTWRGHRHKHSPAITCSLGFPSIHSFLGSGNAVLVCVIRVFSQLLQDFPSPWGLVFSLVSAVSPPTLTIAKLLSSGQLSLVTFRLPFPVFSGPIHRKVFRDPLPTSTPSRSALTPSRSAAPTDRHWEWYPCPPKGEAE